MIAQNCLDGIYHDDDWMALFLAQGHAYRIVGRYNGQILDESYDTFGNAEARFRQLRTRIADLIRRGAAA
jgi:hypothetical protein